MPPIDCPTTQACSTPSRSHTAATSSVIPSRLYGPGGRLRLAEARGGAGDDEALDPLGRADAEPQADRAADRHLTGSAVGQRDVLRDGVVRAHGTDDLDRTVDGRSAGRTIDDRDREADAAHPARDEHRHRRVDAGRREGTVTPPELSGATFTFSNLGMYGMTAITPVIYTPQAAILGVGAAREVLARVDGEIVDRRLMTSR